MAIERILPGTVEWQAFYANHILRYQFARQALAEIKSSCVLDAACGVGYGAQYLSQSSDIALLVAIDRSADALKVAKKQFASDKINYLEDDCHTLNAAEAFAPYNAIVSFETLEHLPRPKDFLDSCYKCLTAGGRIIVSTPNQLVSSPEELNWEYHEKEYTAAEFHTLLESAGFKKIRLFGQQFNIKGKIKNEVRADLNRLWSNPFARFGRWIQQILRSRTFEPVLKETIDDFEIKSFDDPSQIDLLGKDGPFVLIAVAEKNNSL